MKIRILLTGDELVEGRTPDTNGSFLAAAAINMGFHVLGLEFCPDDEGAIQRAITRALVDADALLVSGGLGSTADDLTRQVLCTLGGRPLVSFLSAKEAILKYWSHLGKAVPAGVIVETQGPAGGEPVANPLGLAPGIFLSLVEGKVLCFPGVPSELRAMVADGALKILGPSTNHLRQRVLRVVDMPEALVAAKLGAVLDRGRNPLCGIAAKYGEVVLSLRARAETAQQAEALLDADLDLLRRALGDHIYSEDGRELEEIIVAELRQRAATLSVAESLTGGLIGHRITEIPGASAVFIGDLVTYSNKSKVQLLGVRSEDLVLGGAVSETVVRQMAEGVRKRMRTVYGLATTGIAGPSGGSEENPWALPG